MACLRISLRCAEPDKTFAQLGVDRLRFFLRGAGAASLMELLMAHAVSVALADGPDDAQPVILPPTVLEQVGFAPEEALLPFPARSFSGLPPADRVFRGAGQVPVPRRHAAGRQDAARRRQHARHLRLSRPRPAGPGALARRGSLALGCSPIVNLFPQRCEPIPLDHTLTEYRIVPDARRPQATEIWSVDRVVETRSDGEHAALGSRSTG